MGMRVRAPVQSRQLGQKIGNGNHILLSKREIFI
jgi:hypothetical protein